MASNMKKGKKKNPVTNGIFRLIVIVVAIAFFAYAAILGFGKSKSGSINDIKLGLDLQGGVSITYKVKDGANADESAISDTIYKLQLRAQTYSTEAEVYKVGDDRISVDIPAVNDANEILEELGQPGSLSFQNTSGKEYVSGADIKSAQAGIEDKNGNKGYVVQLTFTDEGAKKFAEATKELVGQTLQIIYDGKVVSAPNVKEEITGGSCQIDNIGSYEEAETLASTIRIGALPTELEELSSEVVGAKLGQEAIRTSLIAGGVGLGIVLIFMIVVYGIMGVAADLALLLYVALLVFLLSAFQVTLTLPGIAGMILSIGMAVDANAIIFARIREELYAGRSTNGAIKEGFAKALSAILDGNITTLIAAAVLWIMGIGTVKGFAQTLALGIILSLFTALTVTRFILNALYNLGASNPKLYGIKEEKRDRKITPIGFLQRRKIFFIASGLVIAIGIGGMIYGQTISSEKSIFNYSLEFKGGTSTTIDMGKDMTLQEVQDEVVPIFAEVMGNNDIQSQLVTGTTQITIKTQTQTLEQRTKVAKQLEEKFKVDESSITNQNISATVSNEMKKDAIVAVIVATICMLIYVWFRFKSIIPASSAVLALIHDVLVVLACYAVLRWTVGNTFIACMLTLVGYSINDSIVILDRIRENRKSMTRKDDLQDVVNLSLTQTLGRSMSTSFTTAIMVLVLLILGVASIREFALPLLVGVLVGTYSSICLVSSMYYIMFTRKAKKDNKK
ncbi:Protein-export membrane protein SecF [Lachnospiraceae bacterium TWA4]|nr:Protein-export membrane protein SecF [Lachnospiraceae bacterium TWA4]